MQTSTPHEEVSQRPHGDALPAPPRGHQGIQTGSPASRSSGPPGVQSPRMGLRVDEAVGAEISPAALETVQQGRLQTLVPSVNTWQTQDTFRAALFTMTPEWTQPRCPSSGARTNHVETTRWKTARQEDELSTTRHVSRRCSQMQHQVKRAGHQVHSMFPFASRGNRQAPSVLRGPGGPRAKDQAALHLLTVLETTGLGCGQGCSFQGLSPRPEGGHLAHGSSCSPCLCAHLFLKRHQLYWKKAHAQNLVLP